MMTTEKAQRYVVGFLLDDAGRVALIRKNRPQWQAGRLNGIGGHVEPGESDAEAMCREFWEETGATVHDWNLFVVMDFPGAVIAFYRHRAEGGLLDSLRSTTDEQVIVHRIEYLPSLPIIPNLSWLVPLAAYTADQYEPIHIHARMAEVS